MSDCASQPFPRFRREGRVGRPGDIVLLLPLALSTKCITCLQLLRALWALWAAPQAGPPRCFCQLRPHPRSAPMSSPCSQPYCPPLTASLGSVQMSFHCSHPPTWLPQQQRCPGKELGVKSAATSMEGVGGGGHLHRTRLTASLLNVLGTWPVPIQLSSWEETEDLVQH